MDSFELNKIAGALIASLLLYMVVTTFADSVYEADAPETPAYYVALPEQDRAAAADEEEEAGPTLAMVLADASVSRGERAFAKCMACHAVEQGAGNKIGPNLHNIVGADIAGRDDFNYSTALAEYPGNWDYQTLSAYLENPRDAIPGNKMAFAGLRDLEERANVIAYLRTNTENPPPLPEVAVADADTPAADGTGDESGTESPPSGPAAAGDDTAAGEAPADAPSDDGAAEDAPSDGGDGG